MRGKTFSAEARQHFYNRYRVLKNQGLKFSIIAARLGLSYSTLWSIVARIEGRGRFQGREVDNAP